MKKRGLASPDLADALALTFAYPVAASDHRWQITGKPRQPPRPREYLTEKEIERLMDAARRNRHGHRDATAILLAYRHSLRASEQVALRWDDIDLTTGRLHVRRSGPEMTASATNSRAACSAWSSIVLGMIFSPNIYGISVGVLMLLLVAFEYFRGPIGGVGEDAPR
jgi:site-specific recombinase XerC